MKLNPIYVLVCLGVITLYSACKPDDLPCDGKANDVFFDIVDTDSSLIPFFDKQRIKYLRTQKNTGIKDTIILLKSLERKKVEPYAVRTDDICPTQYWETTYEFIFKSVNKHFEIYYVFTNHQNRRSPEDFENETNLYLYVTNEKDNQVLLYESWNNGVDMVNRLSSVSVLGKFYSNVIQYYTGSGTSIYANDFGMVRFQGKYTTLELVP